MRFMGDMRSSPLPEGEVGPQGRVRVYALSGNAMNPHPPASPSTSPSGRGEDRPIASSRRIASATPARFSYMSVFDTRRIWNPSDRRISVRCASCARSASLPCVAPSTSTTSLPAIVTKSTTCRPIGCCRLNFQSASLRPRSRYQSRASAEVCDDLSARALDLNRSIGRSPGHWLHLSLRERSTAEGRRVRVYVRTGWFPKPSPGASLRPLPQGEVKREPRLHSPRRRLDATMHRA